MSTDFHITPTPPQEQIADQNLERLLGQAYKPETPDSEFADRLKMQLYSVAREAADARAHEIGHIRAVRRRCAWAMAMAASIALIALIWHASSNHPVQPTTVDPGQTPQSAHVTPDLAAPEPIPSPQLVLAAPQRTAPEYLTARPRPAAPAVETVAIGSTIRTEPGQRRRVTLPDGTVLYINQNTAFRVEADRKVSLSAGEVFVEVAPRQAGTQDATFIVQTARREVAALGTKFTVHADADGTGVVVMQGKVKVNDRPEPIEAGQQLPPGSTETAPAPQLAHVLDWARDLIIAAEAPLVPPSTYQGGKLVVTDATGQQTTLSLRKYHIDVFIQDGFARTTIDQTYFNHNPQRLEGTFHFPLPQDASISRLAMYVDGVLMEGGMVESNYGRQVYDSIVHPPTSYPRDPALLEWIDGTTFRMRVFPLEGRQEKRIILSYTQRLPMLYGHLSYRFPAGHSLESVRDWSFHTVVKDGADFKASSDSHPGMEMNKRGSDLVLDYSARNIKIDRDLAIDLTEPSSSARVSSARFTSTEHDGARYLMMRYHPKLPAKPKREHRDWVFLFESSGDRDPLLARVQVDAVRALLASAEHDDNFAILTAGTEIHSYSPQLIAATPENIKAGIEFLDSAHLIGAFDMSRALTAAEPYLKAGKNTCLVHVGSGTSALGERRDDVLARRIPEGVRYVGVGVGKQWARSFMKLAAERTDGCFTQINPDEPVRWRVLELLSTLNAPRLLDVKVIDAAEKAPFLMFKNTLVQGEELCALTRVDKGSALPESIVVTGKLNGASYTETLPVRNIALTADYLPRTWAKLEIDRLLAQDANASRNQIVELSKSMYVMTPFTSLLVLENEQMYVQYKVDRGRKDHWAMYDCPAKIKVVHEPIDPKPASQPTQQVERLGDKDEKKPTEKRYTIEFSDKPWSTAQGSVMDWLTEQTGLPFVATNMKPQGTLSLSVKNKTLAEVIDLLNNALIPQKYLILRRDRGFILVNADQPIDPTFIPFLSKPEELEEHGNSEVVQLRLKVDNVSVEEIANSPLRKTMSSYGDMVPIVATNSLILIDKVEILKRITDAIHDKNSGDTCTHRCIYIKPRQAESILRSALGDQVPRTRMHYITVNDATNTIIVTGPGDKVAQARRLMQDIDVPSDVKNPNEQRLQAFWNDHSKALGQYSSNVDSAGWAALYRNHGYQIGNSPVDVNPAIQWAVPGMPYSGYPTYGPYAYNPYTMYGYGASQGIASVPLPAYAQPTIMRPTLGSSTAIPAPPLPTPSAPPVTPPVAASPMLQEVVQLGATDPTQMADMFAKMLGSSAGSGLVIAPHPSQNAIIVRGTPERIAEVRSIAKIIDTNPAFSAAPVPNPPVPPANMLTPAAGPRTAMPGSNPSSSTQLGETLIRLNQFLRTRQFEQADNLAQSLLSSPDNAKVPALWRISARIAAQRGMVEQQITRLETALDLEYAALSDSINLQELRSDYATLLALYERLANAKKTLQQPMGDLAERVIRAADRWRSLDVNGSAACQTAARILTLLGRYEAAWEYLTTTPGAWGSWQQLGQMFKQTNSLELAERAYAAACESEPANAQILWERALVTREIGKTDQARQMMERLASEKWAPEFKTIQEQAMHDLGQRP